MPNSCHSFVTYNFGGVCWRSYYEPLHITPHNKLFRQSQCGIQGSSAQKDEHSVAWNWLSYGAYHVCQQVWGHEGTTGSTEEQKKSTLIKKSEFIES